MPAETSTFWPPEGIRAITVTYATATRYYATVTVLGLAALWLVGCGSPTSLEKVQQTGVLRIASVYGRTTCYTGPKGLVGYECELAQGIARSIGATAEVLFTHTPADAVQAVLEGRADIVAASITPNIAQRDQLRFTRAVDRAAPRLVFRMGRPRPKTAADLNGRLLVSEGSGLASRMEMLMGASPLLRAETTSAYDAEDLLFQVANGELDYTIASSALVAINERYYPQIRTAFSIGDPEDVVLALKYQNDRSLFDAAETYLASISGRELARLHDRYYGHIEELDYFSAVQVAHHVRSRLGNYTAMFKASAERHQIDWRLLAAIGYQESHWDPTATSYTGVRGLMMLTNDTAAHYKIENREDPAQSIEGGARVLADILSKIPPEVLEPDRTWMALAAYNQGLGHLIDARALTKMRGGDNLHWVDVRDTYPLLSRPRWANKLRYGFARGREAVDFVTNVRAYLDIITMLSSGVRTLPPPPLRLDPQLRMAENDDPADGDAPLEVLPIEPVTPAEPPKILQLSTEQKLGSNAAKNVLVISAQTPDDGVQSRLKPEQATPRPPPAPTTAPAAKSSAVPPAPRPAGGSQ